VSEIAEGGEGGNLKQKPKVLETLMGVGLGAKNYVQSVQSQISYSYDSTGMGMVRLCSVVREWKSRAKNYVQSVQSQFAFSYD
jgi:hypothetical protein